MTTGKDLPGQIQFPESCSYYCRGAVSGISALASSRCRASIPAAEINSSVARFRRCALNTAPSPPIRLRGQRPANSSDYGASGPGSRARAHAEEAAISRTARKFLGFPPKGRNRVLFLSECRRLAQSEFRMRIPVAQFRLNHSATVQLD